MFQKICTNAELPPGARREVDVHGKKIALFNVAGQVYALHANCPHQGAPLSKGTVDGTMLPSAPKEYVYGLKGQVLRCPWHGWEFDLGSGRSLFDPKRRRVRIYQVKTDGDWICIDV